MPRRRILFGCHEATRTGAPLMLLHFLRWLRAHSEYELLLALVRDGELLAEFGETAAISSVPGPPTSVLPRLDWCSPPRPYIERPAPPDLVYLNTVSAGSVLELVPNDIPVITHVHELEFQLRMMRHWEPEHVAEILARTDQYIAASCRVAKALHDVYAIDRSRIAVCHEFIPVGEQARDAEARARTRASLGATDATRIVGTVATIEWRKGPELFIHLAKQALSRPDAPSDLLFTWVGDAKEHFWREVVRHETELLGVGERVRFIGPVADPGPMLEALDVFVLTSRSDPFPLSCLEAAGRGKPTVCFDTGGIAELLEPDDDLLIAYPDVEAMASRVLELLHAPDEAAEIGKRLAARVREHHDVGKAAPSLLAEIERRFR